MKDVGFIGIRTMDKGIYALAVLVLVAGAALAGPMAGVEVMNTRIAIVKDMRLPPYARIDADVFNESSANLSGEWRIRSQKGRWNLRQDGLDHITFYLWGDLTVDTLRKSAEIIWLSDDELTQDTLRLPLNWHQAEHRDVPLPDEWTISEMNSDAGGTGRPYVSIFVPIPTKVVVLVQSPKRIPVDTLFFEKEFRGAQRVECVTDKMRDENYTAVLSINGAYIAYRALLEPKRYKSKKFYYGE